MELALTEARTASTSSRGVGLVSEGFDYNHSVTCKLKFILYYFFSPQKNNMQKRLSSLLISVKNKQAIPIQQLKQHVAWETKPTPKDSNLHKLLHIKLVHLHICRNHWFWKIIFPICFYSSTVPWTHFKVFFKGAVCNIHCTRAHAFQAKTLCTLSHQTPLRKTVISPCRSSRNKLNSNWKETKWNAPQQS